MKILYLFLLFFPFLAYSNNDNATQLFQEGYKIYKNPDRTYETLEEAVKLFKRSAELGNSNAMYFLGKSYFNGEGVPLDYKTAIDWFHKSNEKGNEYAHAMLSAFASLLSINTNFLYEYCHSLRKSDFDARYSTFNMMKTKDDDKDEDKDDTIRKLYKYQNTQRNIREAIKYLIPYSNINDSTILYVLSKLKRLSSTALSHSFDEFGKTPLTLQLTFQQQKFSTERYLREIKKDKLFLKSLELGNPRALESVYRQFRMHDIKGLYIPDAINSYIKKYKKIKKIDEGRKVLKIKNDAKALLLYKKLNASYYISHIYATGGDGVPLDIEQSEKYAWESFYNGSSIPDTLSSHFIKTPNPSFKYYFFLTSYGNRNYNFYVFVQKFNEFLKRDLDKGIISDVNARSIRNELFEVFKKREQRRYEKIPYVSPLFLKNYYEKSPVKDEELMKKIVLTYYENGLYDCL